MRLPGRLGSTTLGDVLGSLYRARATGVLELLEQSGANAGRAHWVHVDGGLVGAVDSRLRVPRLGEILQSEGFIGDDTLRRLVRRLGETPGRRAGDVLIEEQLASSELVGAALRFQLRRRLDALFGVADASVRFHVARPRSREAPVPLSPHEFLHGRPRARDKRSDDDSRTRAAPPGGRAAPRSRGSAPRRHDPVRSRAFGVLGLSPGAERGDVQRAFRALAREHHPDRFPTASDTERAALIRRFAELSAAYHLLVG